MNGEIKGGAFADLGIDLEFASHQQNLFAGNSEPESGSSFFDSLFTLSKRFENRFQGFLRNSLAGIRHLKLNHAAFHLGDGQGYASRLRKLDGIPQKIDQNLFEFFLVTENIGLAPGQGTDFQVQMALIATQLEHGIQVLEMEVEVEIARPQFHSSRFNLGYR